MHTNDTTLLALNKQFSIAILTDTKILWWYWTLSAREE